jgi:hypothetical protein
VDSVDFIWTPAVYGPKRKLQFTIDWPVFEDEVEKALIADAALSFSTHGYCRYGPLLHSKKNSNFAVLNQNNIHFEFEMLLIGFFFYVVFILCLF